MKAARVIETKMVIPTYGVGKEEKNPMFFEKRVYQGSSGKVYPNPVIEKIEDVKKDREYDAVILENDYIEVVVLPELGGRIYAARDKSNGYDFIYRNHVIKPALVGLLGPWISGGIEFNWPQHHRPSTYMPVHHEVRLYHDGSVSVTVGETENMFGLKVLTEIRLYPDAVYMELNTRVYNYGALPQTFLWWANPAYAVNDDTATIMPPDVTAVMDHGKRAVSEFPIAKGTYYKMDYSAGVDISRYKNIPVPTSFMAYKSNFDFIGGYDYGRHAGLLHVADHHVSPGKKQWTWGCGDFGRAWDRNLTDADGPYVELMTGCFTDNQPDFTFIQPHEQKSFTQYFMPYREVGRISNANKDFCFGTENGTFSLYTARAHRDVVIEVTDGSRVYSQTVDLVPGEVYKLENVSDDAKICITYDGRQLRYAPDMVEKFEIPEPATACPPPAECATTEELYLFGLHIEQYRHATRLPEDYYLEGLKRDPTDLRLNNAYGLLLLRRGMLEACKPYFRKAIDKMTIKNPNPPTTDPFFYLAVAELLTGNPARAYDLFYKCLWSNEHKSAAYYYLAAIEYTRGHFEDARTFAQESVSFGAHDVRARLVDCLTLKRMGMEDQMKECLRAIMAMDPFDLISRFEAGEEEKVLRSANVTEITEAASTYLLLGEFDRAEEILNAWQESNSANPLVNFYIAYARYNSHKSFSAEIARAVAAGEAVYFPNKLMDIVVLNCVNAIGENALAHYYLGNLYYDKRQYDIARDHWLAAELLDPKMPTVQRNLSLYYYNKAHDPEKAVAYMESAWSLDHTDGRVLLELTQLYQLTGKSNEFLLRLLENHLNVAQERDDLYAEYIRLVLENGDAARAEELILSRKFHPWEGGEGKVTRLYKEIKCARAQELAAAGKAEDAMRKYNDALIFPENLGEGKLILDTSNDIYYRMGVLAEQTGDPRATEYYQLAARGDDTVADDMYYNDNPVDYVFYQALAFKKLGMTDRAENIKQQFERYARTHENKEAVIDYFAVSLPDMLIWEQDINRRNREFCQYIRSLAEQI